MAERAPSRAVGAADARPRRLRPRRPADSGLRQAFRDVARGRASAGQQVAMMNYLLGAICAVDESPFDPDPAVANFKSGSQWVGHEVRRLAGGLFGFPDAPSLDDDSVDGDEIDDDETQGKQQGEREGG